MGHGDHWGAIDRDVERVVAEAMPTTIAKGVTLPKVEFALCMKGKAERKSLAAAVRYPAKSPLQYMALLASNERFDKDTGYYLHSGYPYLMEGQTAQVVIRRIIPWANSVAEAIEGQIVGSVNDATIGFFDPLFYANKAAYSVGTRLWVSLAGLAYELRKAAQDEFSVTEGPLIEEERNLARKKRQPTAVTSVTVSMKGAAAYIGHKTFVDDFSFRCPVLKVKRFSLGKRRFRQLEVALMRPNDLEVRIPLYVSEQVLNGYEPTVGDDIEGAAWMQGVIKDKPSGGPQGRRRRYRGTGAARRTLGDS